MSGHVFHPGHQDLHGITVVVRGRGGHTYLGRFHEQTDRGVLLHDAAVHDPSSTPDPVDHWLAAQRKFGIRVAHRTILVAAADTQSIDRFADLP
jgi:phage repressor protein C with HTH and peptisase S24 domain